jgi:hypothetical protein
MFPGGGGVRQQSTGIDWGCRQQSNDRGLFQCHVNAMEWSYVARLAGCQESSGGGGGGERRCYGVITCHHSWAPGGGAQSGAKASSCGCGFLMLRPA